MDELHELITERLDEKAAAAVAAFSGDINAPNDFGIYCGRTVLLQAVLHHCLQTIAALATRGDCNPNLRFKTTFPLHCAVYKPTVLDLLISRFPTLDLHAREWDNQTALHYAASYGCKFVVHRLLDAGADPTIKTSINNTPTWFARKQGHDEIASILSKAEAWYVSTRLAWMTACVIRSKHN